MSVVSRHGDTAHVTVDEITTPTPEVLTALAQLHASTLPQSSLAIHGERLVRAFYRFAIRSPHEHVFIARSKGTEVLGASVSSMRPQSIKRRLAMDWRVAAALVMSLLRRRLSRDAPPHDCDAGREETGSPQHGGLKPTAKWFGPELLHLFVCTDHRGLGLGRGLVEAVEARMRHDGVPELCVRTRSHSDNPAISFYKGLSYQPVAESWVDGKSAVILAKRL